MNLPIHQSSNYSIEDSEIDNEELFEAFIDAPYGVYVVNLQGSILFCNQSAALILGCDATALLNQHCLQVLGRPLEGAESNIHPRCLAVPWALRGDIAPTYTYSLVTITGKQKWVTVTHMLLPSEIPGLSLIVHILYDITDQVEGKLLLQRLGSYLSSIGSSIGSSTGPTAAPANPPTPGQPPGRPQLLTEREMAVLRLLSQGKGTRDIAELLVISEATVRSHVQRVLNKLGTKNRLEAVAAATRMGLI